MQKHNPCQPDPWASSTYQTGSTVPPKSHNGIIALLLILVILLCGVITVLGITNVRLFQMLSGQQEENVVAASFSNTRLAPTFANEPVAMEYQDDLRYLSSPLGLKGESVNKMYQIYYNLPQGLHVQSVDASSCAGRTGIRPGDIITAVNDTPIGGFQDFSQALAWYEPGTRVVLTVYRKAQLFRVEVTVEPWR